MSEEKEAAGKGDYIEMSGMAAEMDAQEKKSKDGEKSTLISCEACEEMRPETVSRLHKAALATSWVSVVFSLATGAAAIVLGLDGNSEALFAYGLDAGLDSLSSVAVVWRFHGSSSTVHNANKERTACMVIGGLFLVSAGSLITKGIVSLVDRTRESKDVVLYESFALSCAIVSVAIAVAKIYLGHRLHSRALATDSIITLVGAAACVAGVAGLQLYVHDTYLWYMDALFGMILGAFLLAFGIRILYKVCREEDQEEVEVIAIDQKPPQ